MKLKHLAIVTALATILLLQGCAAIIVAGAATGVSVANDRRTAATVVDDQVIELKAAQALRGDKTLTRENVHIGITSYNHIVLLTGQASNRKLRERVVSDIRNVKKISRIHNEITLDEPLSLNARGRDAVITAKTKSTLLGAKGLRAIHVKVVTENGVVYLMGLVTHEEGQTIAKTVQQVQGVERVVKVFEYID